MFTAPKAALTHDRGDSGSHTDKELDRGPSFSPKARSVLCGFLPGLCATCFAPAVSKGHLSS